MPRLSRIASISAAVLCCLLAVTVHTLADHKGKPHGGPGGGGGGENPPPANHAFVAASDSGLFLLDSNGTEQRLTRSGRKALTQRVLWSPNGSLIAYVQHPDRSSADQNIYIIAPDGSGETLIRSFVAGAGTVPDTFRDDLVWAPDGSRLLFTENDDIWSLELDGTLELVANINTLMGRESVYWWPHIGLSFSPDLDAADGYQGQLAFSASTIENENSDVFLVDVNIDELGTLTTGAVVNFTNTPDVFESRPLWDPSGVYLLVQRDIGPQDYDAALYDVLSGNSVVVQNTRYNRGRFTWSPDGMYLAYNDGGTSVQDSYGNVYYFSPWDPTSPAVYVNGDDFIFVDWNPNWEDDISP